MIGLNIDTMLNKRERKILNSIIFFVQTNGYPPSCRELSEICSLKSTSTVHYYLNSLKSKGYITIANGKQRSIKVLRNARGMLISE